MKYSITITLFLVSLSAPAQKTGIYRKLEAGINGIGTSLEIPASNRMAVEPVIGAVPGYMHNEKYGQSNKTNWYKALPKSGFHGSTYGKFLYTGDAKSRKRRFLLDSDNFTGVKVKYVSATRSRPQYLSNTILANLNWGGRFNTGKQGLCNHSSGTGYDRNFEYSYGLFYPAFDLTIAYVSPFSTRRRQ
ncbi:MAG: hypothetical protein LBR26_13725 [Prevotella sp.]|jgi:hypothetical protein|nr:hypothetical protein [Prevotella sp.]